MDRARRSCGLRERNFSCTVALAGVAIVIGARESDSWLGNRLDHDCLLGLVDGQVLIRLRCSDSGATFYGTMARCAWPQH